MKITVDSNNVIRTYKLMGELFRKYTLDTNVTLEVMDDSLTIRAGAGSFIFADLHIISSEDKRDIVCKTHFIDISKVIEKDSQVTFDIDDDNCSISSQKLNINLPPSIAEVPKRDIFSSEYNFLDRDMIFSSMSKLIKMNTLAGIYKTDGSFIFCNEFMQRKFAVALMQVESQSIQTSIDLNNANLLYSFIRGAETLYFAEYSTYYVFKADMLHLGIPKIKINGIRPLEELLENYTELGEVDLGEDNPLAELKNIKDLLSDKEVEIHFYRNALALHKTTATADININIGTLNLNEYLTTAETLMGVFYLILSVIGPKFKLLKGDDSLCFTNGTCTSIISVI